MVAGIPLGPYVLLKTIGAGGMSHVWLAVHTPSRRRVAVKVVTSAAANNAKFRTAFRSEVRAVAALRHPNIVLVHDYGEIPADTATASEGRLQVGTPYLVMEVARGGTLSVAPKPWVEFRFVLLTLLQALAYAHARGVVHRDLKPRNVLMCSGDDERPGLKLADFGIAWRLEPGDPFQGGGGGTVNYMAPEQICGRWREFGPWTDLYALGITAWRLATGRPTFVAESKREVARRHLTCEPPPLDPWSPVPPGFESWLHRLLEKDPRERFQRAADAAWALRQLGAMGDSDWTNTAPNPLVNECQASTTARWSEVGAIEPPPSRDSRDSDTAGPSFVFSETPRVPTTWRPRVRESLQPFIAGVGLGLYGLRAMPLVGRESERDMLWGELVKVSEQGTAHGVIVQGASGTGKSRLVEWICERAHEVGAANTLRAVHSPRGGASDGLGPMMARELTVVGIDRSSLAEMVEARLRRTVGDTDPYEGLALCEVIHPAQIGGPGVRFDDQDDRYAVIARYLRRLAATRPVLVWLDDVHWGPDALGLAEYLLRPGARSGFAVLVLMTVRSDSVAGTEVGNRLDQLGDSGISRLELGPLMGSERRQLVRQLLGLQGDLASVVEERTAGNPLFAVQLVGDWVKRGLLVSGKRGFLLPSGTLRLELPNSLYAVWGPRVDEVLRNRQAQAGVALELAAVLGETVDIAEWQAVCAHAGVEPCFEVVEALIERCLARTDGGGPERGWSFVHGMFREAVERRARMAGRWSRHHATCAAVLGEGAASVSPDRLARHLIEARDFDAAAEPLVQAARHRRLMGDIDGAERLMREWERAMECADASSDDRRWAEGWIAWSWVCRAVGDGARAYQLARRVVEFGVRTRDEALVARGYRELGASAHVLGRSGEAARVLKEALVILTRLGLRGPLGRARMTLSWILRSRGRLQQAVEAGRSAVEDFRAVGEEGYVLAVAYERLGTTLSVAGDGEEAQEWISLALEVYEREQARPQLANCHLALGDLCRLRGDLRTATSHYEDALTIYRELGSVHEVVASLDLAIARVEQRRYDDARQILEQLLPRSEAYGDRACASAVHAYLMVTAAYDKQWRPFDARCADLVRLIGEDVDLDVARGTQMAAVLAARAGQGSRAMNGALISARHWRGLGRERDAQLVEDQVQLLVDKHEGSD